MIYFYYSKRNIEVVVIRDNVKGGALTETTLLILLALYQPNHGYGIMQFVEKETLGRVVLGAGTLYGAINTLFTKKWIAPIPATADDKKKAYIITEIGKQKVEDELKRLADVLSLAHTIIKEEPE